MGREASMIDSKAMSNPIENGVGDGSQRGLSRVCSRLEGLMNARCVGFALMRAWVYLLFLDITATFLTGNNNQWLQNSYIVSTVFLCLVLFACALFRPQAERWAIGRTTRYFAPILATVGTLCIAASVIDGVPAPVFCFAGGALTGIGSALIEVGYGQLYKIESSDKTNLEVPFAFLIAAVVFSFVVSLDRYASAFICSVLPMISGWILASRLEAFKADRDKPRDANAHIDLMRFALKIGACAMAVGVADGAVRAVYISHYQISVHDFYQFPLVIAGVLTTLIIYIALSRTPDGGLRKVYKIVVLIMAVFYMMLPILEGYTMVGCTLALMGYGTFNVLIWLILAEMAHKHSLNSMVTFGIGWGMVSLGVLIGSLAGRLLTSFEPFDAQMLSLVAAASVGLILLSYLFVFKESDLARIITPAEALVADAAESPAVSHRVRFMDACDVIAQECELTPRETEVMKLYAKGLTGTQIQDELSISRGTFSTHLRHIYEKTGQHSRPELIALIESNRGPKE